MAKKRLSMRKIEEVLRLSFDGRLGIRAIAQISPSTVGDYLRRARAAGLSWPLPPGLDEVALERRLFSSASAFPTAPSLARLDGRPSGAQAQRGDACAVMGRVQDPPSGGAAIHPIL